MGKAIPELDGKLTVMAFSVPTYKALVMNLNCLLEKAVKYEDIERLVKQAPEGSLKGVLGYTEDRAVS